MIEEPFNNSQCVVRDAMDKQIQELQAAHANMDQLRDHLSNDFVRHVKHVALIKIVCEKKNKHCKNTLRSLLCL